MRVDIPGPLLPRGRVPSRVVHLHLWVGRQRRHLALWTCGCPEQQEDRGWRYVVSLMFKIDTIFVKNRRVFFLINTIFLKNRLVFFLLTQSFLRPEWRRYFEALEFNSHTK